MYILALETTGAHASAAVIGEDGKTFWKKSPGVLNHLQELLPMTQKLLSENGLTLDDIGAVAASEGPGSFTGIRIGVSTARAIAQMRNLPAIGVPTLPAFAYNDREYGGLICPLFDARRNQVYAGAYKWEDGKISEKVKGAPYTIEEFLNSVKETGEKDIRFYGDGIKAYGEFLTFGELAPEEIRLQEASSAAKLALEYWKAGKTTDYNSLQPNYMRKPEAQRKLEEKKRKAEKND